MNDNNELTASAVAVMRQAEKALGEYGIPVDPEVAEFMGAFPEQAIGLDDMLDDGRLAVNIRGEVSHE